MEFGLSPVSFSELPGWQDDDPRPLFAAMANCLAHMTTVKPYKTGSLGITSAELAEVFSLAAEKPPLDANEARQFFETHFQPARIVRSDAGPGFVTAFYEPEVEVSDEKTGPWIYPFYRRPPELVDVDDANRPAGMAPSYAFARQNPDGSLVEFADRKAVDCGALEGRGLEIAWARSRVDVFFAHVQGAARLAYRDGSVRRITYAAKAGHPFSAIGRLLVDEGEIPLADISMDAIRDWLAAHPDQMDRVLWHNRSYIFFRNAEVDDLDLGPIAAAKVPLIAGRSLAVDRLIHTFSTPFYIASASLTHLDDGQPFQRLMMALDTGTAIVGPARGDIFTGSGLAAGHLAGNVRNDADFFVLLPKASAQRLL